VIDLEAWLCAGLGLARLQKAEDQRIAETLSWLVAALAECAALPPPGVILDLGRMLLGAGLEDCPPLPIAEPRLRTALRAYEEQILGRLAVDLQFQAAVDAAARLPAAERAEAVAVFCAQVLQRLGFEAGIQLSPATARRVLAHPPAELLERGLAALARSGAGGPLPALAAGYEGLVQRARHQHALCGPKEVFVLENLGVLRGLTGRVAIEQMLEAAQRLDRELPRRLRAGARRRGNTGTRVDEEGAYPTGGFSAISTSGSIESLVCSELVYMEDGEEIDLFDVRYAEGELLFYTRDESVFVRQARSVAVVLHPSLERSRVKDPALPWQNLVLGLGLLFTVVSRLSDWLTGEALRFHLLFPGTGAAPTPLAAEAALCEVLFREWIEKEMVEVLQPGDLAEALALAAERGRRADASLLLLSAEEPGPPPPGAGHALWLGLGESPRFERWTESLPAPREDEELPAFRRWLETGRALLQELL
jgi:hypothetical protein